MKVIFHEIAIKSKTAPFRTRYRKNVELEEGKEYRNKLQMTENEYVENYICTVEIGGYKIRPKFKFNKTLELEEPKLEIETRCIFNLNTNTTLTKLKKGEN